MKIALIGYGKMGKAIEIEALARGHQIVLKAGRDWTSEQLDTCDIAIEFTRPEHAIENIEKCLTHKTPVVVGTTGWYEQYIQVCEKINRKEGAMLTASNFSIGVNLFFKLNEQLAKIMNSHVEYDVTMEEIHHTHKLDAPSGTAITLAESVIQMLDRKNKWVGLKPDMTNDATSFDLNIVSHRIDEVPGTHKISYESEIDIIEISHIAKNRKGFALGAVIAAEWLVGKKGVYTMKDVLSL